MIVPLPFEWVLGPVWAIPREDSGIIDRTKNLKKGKDNFPLLGRTSVEY